MTLFIIVRQLSIALSWLIIEALKSLDLRLKLYCFQKAKSFPKRECRLIILQMLLYKLMEFWKLLLIMTNGPLDSLITMKLLICSHLEIARTYKSKEKVLLTVLDTDGGKENGILRINMEDLIFQNIVKFKILKFLELDLLTVHIIT